MRTLILLIAFFFNGISLATPTLVTFDPSQWLSPVYEDIIVNEYGNGTLTHIKSLLKIGCSVSITINIGE